MTFKVEKIGQEQQPVVMLDNAMTDAGALRDIAANRNFKATAAQQTDLRAPAPIDFAQTVLTNFEDLISQTFDLRPLSLAVTASEFSMVISPPPNSPLAQQFPQHDGADQTLVAVLHFLSGEEQGGTAFYRHRATGFETVNQARLRRYRMVLETEIAEQSGGSAPLFDEIACFPAAFNRILIYRSIALHSPHIPENASLPKDPKNGRLTVKTLIKGAGG